MNQPNGNPLWVGPYRVFGKHRHGGMGEILRGHDERLNRPVALKRLLPDFLQLKEARRRFRREAEIATQVCHDSIVEIYSWVRQDDGDWLVMEWIHGRGLDELLSGEVLEPSQVRSIAIQVAEALMAIHGEGFVHRDLKPANIMVSPCGDGSKRERVKLIDFGLAKAIDSAEEPATSESNVTAEGQIPGTLAWMSPEQAMGCPVDARSDLFSLGTLIYTMLSGHCPSSGQGALESLRRICVVREKPLVELVPGAPRDLIDLVDQLLEKDPDSRPPSAKSVLEALAPRPTTNATPGSRKIPARGAPRSLDCASRRQMRFGASLHGIAGSTDRS